MLSCLHPEGQFGVLNDDITIIILINFRITQYFNNFQYYYSVNTALPPCFLGASWMYATTMSAFGR